jgi:hypothetical protein
MTRGILIAGNESALFNALAAEAVKRVESFAAAFIPNRHTGEGRKVPSAGGSAKLPSGSHVLIPWNPGSPVSARGLVLAAENRLEHIDEAILVCVPPAVNSRPAALDPALVENMTNDQIKGWFFLAKELAALFKTRGAGTLGLVVPEITPAGSRDALPDLLGAAAAAAFRSFAQGLLSAALEDPYQTLGFTAGPGDDAAFAAFIFKTIEEPGKRGAGKWHRFGKLNFFSH